MGRRIAGLCMMLVTACGGGAAGGGAAEGAGGEAVEGDGDAVVIIQEEDNRVSTSAGEEGGVTVLWPRIMGFADGEPALLQARMVEMARRVFPNRPLDIRPEPERVCPRSGCNGASIGVLLIVQDGTCATVAILGGRGPSDLTLVPWTGLVTVRDEVIPFREPPESHLVLNERSPCEELAQHLAENEALVEATFSSME